MFWRNSFNGIEHAARFEQRAKLRCRCQSRWRKQKNIRAIPPAPNSDHADSQRKTARRKQGFESRCCLRILSCVVISYPGLLSLLKLLRHPLPVAVAIRSPSSRDARWMPAMSVSARINPCADWSERLIKVRCRVNGNACGNFQFCRRRQQAEAQAASQTKDRNK